MKTSNIILLATSCALTALAGFQVWYGVHQIRKTKEAMRPIVEQIDAANIRVIRMERGNYNYIANNTDIDADGSAIIRFTHSRPTPEMLRIEGDTLVVATDKRVVLNIPTATHLIEPNGEVVELSPTPLTSSNSTAKSWSWETENH